MAAAWELVPCLAALRAELNELAPARDHASDGSIGDAAHSSSSDHTPDEVSDALRGRDADSRNEVHAVDLDSDLRTPGLSMEMVVQHLLGRCRTGAEKRLRYVIFNRRIWSASDSWRERTYTGPSPHDHHAHFSASYESAREADTSPWHLEDIPVALTDADKAFIRDQIREEVRASEQRQDARLTAAASAWDDTVGRGENRRGMAAVVVEIRDSMRQLLERLPAEPAE